jgi:hypothetical protein
MSLLLALGGVPGVYTLSAAKGSFVLTGNAVTLKKASSISATQGVYSLNSNAQGLTIGRKINASQGSYTYSGYAALFAKTNVLQAIAGSYGLTGNVLGTTYARSIQLSLGSYPLSGKNISYIYNPLGGGGGGGSALTSDDIYAAKLAIAQKVASIKVMMDAGVGYGSLTASSGAIPATITELNNLQDEIYRELDRLKIGLLLK